ncbi:unnamed protein product [Auanema sp. JU1783]|nr:unnamed protein product [Auanema sp. JU1783]
MREERSLIYQIAAKKASLKKKRSRPFISGAKTRSFWNMTERRQIIGSLIQQEKDEDMRVALISLSNRPF